MRQFRSSAMLGALCVLSAVAQTEGTGRRQYEERCAGCHGADGAGGGHGPSIVDMRRARATTVEAVRAVIQKGIPDGGMPAFAIPDAEATTIASYVMRLRQPAATAQRG